VVPAEPGATLPPADLYVVDLAGKGLSRWTEAAQARLLQALDGAPAVLIASAFDQTWSALDAGLMKSQSLILLRKPYGIEDMRTALKQAAAGRVKRVIRAPAPPAALPITPPAPLRAPVPAVAAVQAPAPATPSAEVGGLTAIEFQARLAGMPASEPQLFFRHLAQALALRKPFEVRVSFLKRLIFNPADRWVASNTPVSVVQGLCHNDALAAAATMDAIDEKDAMARAQRLDLQLQPLEVFLGSLMPGRLEQHEALPS
jgi:hypothetical protein